MSFVATISFRYKMSYPQAPIPRRKRKHSETEETAGTSSEGPKPPANKSEETSEQPSKSSDASKSSDTSKSSEDKDDASKEGDKGDEKKEDPKEGVKEGGESEEKKDAGEAKKEPEVKKEENAVAVKTETTAKEQKTTTNEPRREGNLKRDTYRVLVCKTIDILIELYMLINVAILYISGDWEIENDHVN